MYGEWKIFSIFFLSISIFPLFYLFIWERKEHVQDREPQLEEGAEGGGEANSLLSGGAPNPNFSSNPDNQGIRAWAKATHLTDWATQAPIGCVRFLIVNTSLFCLLLLFICSKIR